MYIYKNIKQQPSFLNVKTGKIENVDFSKMAPIYRNDPTYKGWVKQFLKEIPDQEFANIIATKNYIVPLFKNKNTIYAVIFTFGESNRVQDLTEEDIDLLKIRYINSVTGMPFSAAERFWRGAGSKSQRVKRVNRGA